MNVTFRQRAFRRIRKVAGFVYRYAHERCGEFPHDLVFRLRAWAGPTGDQGFSLEEPNGTVTMGSLEHIAMAIRTAVAKHHAPIRRH